MPENMIESRGLHRVYKTKKQKWSHARCRLHGRCRRDRRLPRANGAGRPPRCGCSPPCSSQPVAMPPWPGAILRPAPSGSAAASVTWPRVARLIPKREPAIVDHARMYGIDADVAAATNGLFDQLDLEGLWSRQCKTLSGGQRRRLDIAMGLVHQQRVPRRALHRSRPSVAANLWEHVGPLQVPTWTRPCSSPLITWMRPTFSVTASSSSTTAPLWPGPPTS